MATVLYEPAKAGCMRSLAIDLSRFVHKVFFLHVKSTVASGFKQVGALAHTSATRLCCFEQSIPPSTRHCMVWSTTGCRIMSFLLQKFISCEVNSFALSIRK